MTSHRLHEDRIRFRILGVEWEVLTRKLAVMKSGELAPKMRISPQQRSEVTDVISDQGESYNGR